MTKACIDIDCHELDDYDNAVDYSISERLFTVIVDITHGDSTTEMD